MFSRPVLNGLFATFGLSVIIFAAGAGISLLVPEDYAMATAILTITTCGILCSLSKQVRNTKKTFQLGQYIILIFCLAVGAMADLSKLVQTAPDILGFVLLAVFGAMILHVLLSAVFKVDADTVIITAVAAICSPPFVPLAASALKNKEIVVSGLTVGIIGYALGNYLGVAVAYGLRALGNG